MVHYGGQRQGLAASGWRRVFGDRQRAAHGRGASTRKSVLTLAVTLGLGGLTPAPAAAQAAIGFQAGATVDPEQVFGGVFYQTGDLGRGIRLRPGIDGATGDGLRIATVGLDFVYGYPLGANGWTFLAGGGPAVVITRIPAFDVRDTGVGFNSMVGFGHDSGLFFEIRFGSGRAQQLKAGVGWAITLN